MIQNKKRLDVLDAYSKGKTVQFFSSNKWEDFVPQNQLDRPNIEWDLIDYWRIKPGEIDIETEQELDIAIDNLLSIFPSKDELECYSRDDMIRAFNEGKWSKNHEIAEEWIKTYQGIVNDKFENE